MPWLSLLLCSTLAWAGDPPVDAGLSTQVQGAVQIQTGAAAAPLVAFSKLRVGDRLVVPAGATVEVVYFGSGRRETWTGPAELLVGAAQGQILSGGAPAVQQTDAALGRQLQGLPLLISRAERDRAGQGVVRSGTDVVDPRSLLDDEERAILAAAKERFDAMRQVFSPRDVLPDIYYASVLRTYGLDTEADSVLRAARDRCELCDLPPLTGGTAP